MKHMIRKTVMFLLFLSIFLTMGSISLNSEAKSSGSELELNYLVVDSSYVDLGAEQKIVASIGDGTGIITDAILCYENQRTGQTYSQQAEIIDGDTLLFSLNFKNASDKGAYHLKSIRCIVDGVQSELSLEALGVSATFGVATEVDTQADAYVIDEDDAASSNVVTFDADGNRSSELSIAQALHQEAESPVSNISAFSLMKRYNAKGNFVIVLDPGHGGTDPGATRTHNGVTYYERNINLKIAQYCKEELEKTTGITVFLTREDNESPLMDRWERTQFAISKGADVIVSLHINSTGSATTTASGSQVYCPNGDTESGQISRELADKILEKLEKLGLQNRGKFVDEGLGMIGYPKQYGIPGILVEHAFINNAGDVSKYLSSDEQLKKLGIADANGILEYFKYDELSRYSPVFDAEYYAEHYADLQRAFGNDEIKLLNHFINFGMKEGRQGNSEFNVVSYLYKYPDLRRAYGNNLESYYLHYIRNGQKEGRQATGTTNMQGCQTVYNGVDYSAVYDYKYYVAQYPDVKKQYGYDDAKTLEYFVNTGMANGQRGSESFDVISYRLQYADLRKAFGSNLKSYYLHYINNGKKEKRQATGNSTMYGYQTIYNGVDYKAVYDFNFYINKYIDIKNAFGYDETKVLSHFVNNGMKEGRQASADFDVQSYKRQYVDLRNAFGSDLKSYYLHYINNGVKEKRQGIGCNTLQDGVTKLNGVDYSSVYDFNYYIKYNADIKQKYSNDDIGALSHFVNNGMKEGRQAKESFDVVSYMYRYADLRRAYGTDWKSYYLHYMRYGIKENRQTTGVTSMQNYQTLYNGVDYKDVYDYNYYVTMYADIRKAFGYDEAKVLAHFVNNGMREGRQGSDGFDVHAYRSNYTDLQNAFGDDLQKYYMHYLNHGIKEGRSGK